MVLHVFTPTGRFCHIYVNGLTGLIVGTVPVNVPAIAPLHIVSLAEIVLLVSVGHAQPGVYASVSVHVVPTLLTTILYSTPAVNVANVLDDWKLVPPLLLYSSVPADTVAFTVTEFNVPPVQFDTILVIVGLGFTVTLLVAVHPVLVCVNVNVTVPAVNPVTKPEDVTDATDVVPLHVPPLLGNTFAVLPTHTAVAPSNTGTALTMIVPVALTVPHPPVNGML